MTIALDETLSLPARLKICGYLAGCEEADFKAVQEYCALSQPSLSKHLTVLSDKGYVTIRKVSSKRYTKTRLSVSDAGRAALAAHIAYLQAIADAATHHAK